MQAPHEYAASGRIKVFNPYCPARGTEWDTRSIFPGRRDGGVNQVSLSWTAPAGAVTYAYNIKRAPSGTGAFATVGSTAGTSFTDTTVSGGVPYDYAITAVSAAESGLSNIFSATPLTPPPRTNDHGEGLLDDNCGSTSRVPAPWPLALAAIAMVFARRRR
jgi:MYXO-CTERM domain-containing protein